MRIHNKDWATYDLLGDIEYKNRSKLASLRFYKKAAELPNSPNEMKKKFIDMRNIVKQDTKIAFLCLPGLDNFLKDIVETFSLGYDVKLVVTTDGNQIAESIKWADIVWLEWANDLAVFATNQIPEIQNKKVVCRLHGYEIFGGYPQKINWTNIDQLIFVGDHIKRILHELHPNLNINPDKEIIVYNGVDLDKFKFLVHKPGYNLSVLAHINYKKDPSAWIQIINKLKEIDNRYKLHVGGDFQDPRYKIYFDYIKKEMKLENNFILHGWINEVDKFLEDKDYTLSTSIHEGHPYNILESMARGIKPVILNYSGAKEQWPNELIYNTIDEAVEKITEQTYDSESYRRFIEDNYSLEKQIDNMEYMINQFNSFKKKEMKAEKPLTIIDTKKYYDNFLEYLKMDHIRPNPRHNHVKKTLEQLIKPGSKVLDIGCGTGISSYFMASKGAIVTAVDLSNKLIEFAKQNSFHENVTYIVADATKLKLDKRFDIITIIDSMEHIPKDNIMDFFNVIERHSLNQTIIYLNIPDGRYQRFIKNNYPERLQIIDEDYDHLFLIENFKKIGFEISFLNIFGLDLPYQYNEFIFISEEALNNSYKKNILKYIK
jgi:glycosyltransferase involved in cell wall biosynthesis/SAM-dependent methyltransferase